MLLDFRSLEEPASAVAPPPPSAPPVVVPTFASGGPPYRPRKTIRVVQWRYDLEALQALYAAGELDEDEFAALLGDARETVRN